MPKTNNQKGFAVIEGVLVVLLLAAIGTAGYFAYKNHQLQTDKTQAPTASSSSPSPAPAPKLASATLAAEKLSFSYPVAWKLTNTTGTSDLGTKHDDAVITSPSGFTVKLQTGLDGLGGACPDCKIVLSKPVTSMGQPMFINFVSSTGDSNSFDAMNLTSNQSCMGECIFDDKNIFYQGSPESMLFVGYPSADSEATLPTSQITTNSDILAAESILSSLHYQ